MILRIRGRRAFQRLARDGVRIRRTALWCTWCPDSHSTATSVAFALPSSLGPAAARNRLRRRLRALVRELDRADQLPSGLMLIGAHRPAIELTFDQLRREVTELIVRVRSSAA